MKPTKPALLQPSNIEDLIKEEDRREAAEQHARAGLDGRFLRRKASRHQIGVKTTEAVKKEFDRLRMMTGKSYTDLFEEAILDLGKKYNDAAGIKR